MYRLFLQGVILSVIFTVLVKAECGGDVTACDTTVFARYPVEGHGDAGNITFSQEGCVAAGGSLSVTCSCTQQGLDSFDCDSGTWAAGASQIPNPTIVCFAACQCPEPEAPTNGYIVGNDYNLFKTINYICNDTYRRIGASQASCQQDGTWNQQPPECKAPCARPDVNATVTLSDPDGPYNDGDILNFECDGTTTTMIGADTATCRDGVWDPSPPSCYYKCTIPETTTATLGNGQTSGSVVDHETMIDFQCNEGRHYNDIVIGDTTGSQTCNNGEFPSPFATCYANCTAADLTAPAFAQIEPDSPTYYDKTTVHFSCESGVLSVPSATGTCEDGTWSVPGFECVQPLNCSDPGSPTNGRANENDFSHGAEVSFTCNANFTLMGQSSISCNNGSWSGNVPTCNENPDPVTNGSAGLECRSDSIRVTIERSVLPDLAGDVIRFENDPNCTGVIDGDFIVFTTMFDQCGTTKEEDGDLDVYKNRIVNGKNSGNVVSRDITVSFPITCFYERVHRLEYGYSASGSAGVVQQSLEETGSYSATFDFAMYTDDTFTTKTDSSATNVPVNQRAFFGVEATTVADQRVVIDSCWTTPTSDPDDSRRYNLISDGCVVEQTVMRHDLGMNGLAAFSLSGFTYIDTTQIYLYCKVAICLDSDTSGECAPCGNMQARRRRGVNSGHLKDLSVGPVRWVKQDTDELMDIGMALNNDVREEGSVGENARPWMTAVVVMATVMGVMFVAIVVLVRKSRRQSSRFN
nr:CUB and sushi domain-containing protein 3-like isoform X2 [Lytechinus pictus]